ncbi:WD40 repeat domain-containing protein [Coleofasciculus sp.]|uniref:WD40 repeat domain-containing protein n=1 Tax=Coleofasciculus sp. TaxID=3100458 RepID=UPI003A4A5068
MSTGKLKPKNILRGHEERISGIISLDSGNILSWSDDTTLRIWSLESSTPTHVLDGHDAQVTHALNLPEGLITSTAYDGSLCVWEARTGTLERKVIRPELSFMGTAYWCPNCVVSWDLEGNLISWDISTGQAISILKDACFRYYQASMARPFLLLQNRGVAVTWPSIALEFWDLQTGECVHSAMEHGDAPEGGHLLPNDRILTWSNDRTLKIWTQDGIVEATLRGHENDIRNAFALDNGDIVSWSSDGTVRIWDTSTTQSKCVFAQHNNFVLHVWRVSTNFLLSQSLDGRCHLWDKVTGESVTQFDAEVNGGIILSTSRFLSWGHTTMSLWDLNSGECVQTLTEHEAEILGAKMVNAKTLITWSKDATLRVWELT